MILLGNTVYALAIVMFILPNDMITGGTTGLGIAIHHYFGLPIHTFVLIFNTLMFLLGAAVLGMKFALTTLVSTFYYPVILGVLEQIPALQNVTDDKMLSTICGGLMIGMGIGVVIRCGASTGGMDIPPLVLNRYFKIPVSVSLYVFDMCILLGQAVYNPLEGILYGILLILVYSVVLDKLMLMGTTRTEVKVVSGHAEEIRKVILSEVDRGVTLLYGESGYLQQDTQVILSIVSNRELPQVEKLIHSIDPESFMIISRVSEVRGRGFSMSKEYK